MTYGISPRNGGDRASKAGALLGGVDPESADSIYRITATALGRGYAEETMPLLEAAANRHGGDARMWQISGWPIASSRTWRRGRGLRGGARLAPADALIAHSLARSTLEAGCRRRAVRAALRLAPNDAAVLLGLAAAEFAEGRIDSAIDRLDRVLAAHPGWIEGHRTPRGCARCAATAGFAASFEAALATAPREWSSGAA